MLIGNKVNHHIGLENEPHNMELVSSDAFKQRRSILSDAASGSPQSRHGGPGQQRGRRRGAAKPVSGGH
jgi:hypothetical protein